MPPQTESIVGVQWDIFAHSLHFKLSKVVGRIGLTDDVAIAVTIANANHSVALDTPQGAMFHDFGSVCVIGHL